MVSDRNVFPTEGTETFVFFDPYKTDAKTTVFSKRRAIRWRGLALEDVEEV